MAWIHSFQEVKDHPKTIRFARYLGVSRPEAIGILHLLWWWSIDYAEDGSLARYDAADIADACMWERDSETLASALSRAGWLDQSDDGAYSIHDWDEHQGRLIAQRVANRERARAAYQRKSIVSEESTHSLRADFAQSTGLDKRREEKKREESIPPMVPPDGGTLSPALEKLIPPGQPKPEPQPDGNSQRQKPTRAAKTTARAAPALTSQEQAKLVEKWAGTFGLEGVGDRITEALDHEAARKRGKSGSWYAYVNGWLREDAAKGAVRLGPAAIRSGAAQLLPNGHGPPRGTRDAPPGLMVVPATDELTQEQIDRDREVVEAWRRAKGRG